MGTLGGARPGAGRPRKADKYRPQIAAAEQRIVDHLPEIIDSMLTLADGVTVQETNPQTGETRVYTRPPDRAAGEYLINRIMGKPTERLEVDDVSELSDAELIARLTGIVGGGVSAGAETPDDADDETSELP